MNSQSSNNQLYHQITITHYISHFISKINNMNNQNIITTEERVQIYKTLSFNFFDDNTLILVYYTRTNILPLQDHICAQFGFINCKNIEEKYNLLTIYKTCFEKCYPDLFVFKPLQILYDVLKSDQSARSARIDYFCKDSIAEFIIYSYTRIQNNDFYFYWFLENKNIVKHNLNYYDIQQDKQNVYSKSKSVHF
jgi:hypothetical protein